MAKYTKAVAGLQAIINQAKECNLLAIEPDSIWETGYEFIKIELLERKINIFYNEYNGSWKEVKDSYYLSQTEDINYVFSWIKRSINKGYRQAAKEQAIEDKTNN